MPREWSSGPYKGSGLEGGSRTPMRRRSRGMGAQYDVDVRWCTTATPVDGRRHGRCGLAMAYAARGARVVGKEGGAAQGSPRRADQRTKADLGVRAQQKHAATHDAGARSGAPGAKTVRTGAL
jgi:hypothetical protein